MQRKIFAIGFNKSGTTSIHKLFESLGLRSYHGTVWRSCDDISLLNSYDCFSDGSPNDLSKFDKLFADSKYIWQVRELESWIYSRLAHIEIAKTNPQFTSSKYWDITETAVTFWIKRCIKYHLYLYDYFKKRPQDVIMVNIIRDIDAATKICNFLGYSGSYETPKMNINSRKEIPEHHIDLFKKCISDLKIPEYELEYDVYCPNLASRRIVNKYPPDSGLLRFFPKIRINTIRY